ncbi:putative spermidine/putrescine transport system permease protein [Stella humosa]|uniref:Putative spermidine/putrescine transport system permease protein n=1 Tax=Stella humosa TaxID=94 RepID=A0A3N1KW62_9PROT|nr:ABC transporter permease [Stella humosa]ROP83467.1 putative spermidine/putrescine transport system permease protein [Stella humosa]BBK33261.1 polyamine ABC transporter substrate-binding protein [Stella humosa]
MSLTAAPTPSRRFRPRLGAWLLVLPLFLFAAGAFILPISLMLVRSVQDPDFATAFPRTAVALARWDGVDLPPPATARVFVDELQAARGSDRLSPAATRLNADIAGFRSLLLRTARNPPAATEDALGALAALDPRWGERATWSAMRRAAGPLTDYFLLAAVDLQRDAEGAIVAMPETRAVFVTVFVRTLWIGLVVTVLCLVLGYPVAYLIASATPGWANLLLVVVLIPFWTSVLVRTTAWVVLLQRDGLVNTLLRWTGLVERPLELIYNRTGVIIAMVHVLLPLMILPLYSVMKGIGPAPMRAAMSLGARPLEAFARVYLPQTRAGIAAGCLLVYISAIGYYVTPELVGGGGDQMISYFIAFYTNRTLNWGLAAALSLILLLATGLLYLAYARLDVRADGGR